MKVGSLTSGYRVVLFGESATALSAAACFQGCAITVVCAPDEPRLASFSRFVEGRILLQERSISAALRSLRVLRERANELLMIFPCSDAWIDTLSQDLPGVLQCGRMLPSTAEDCALTLDKLFFAKKVDEVGLPQPKLYRDSVSADWVPTAYPFVLKPYSTYKYANVSGVKANVVNNEEEWRALDKQMLCDWEFLAQEFVQGASISVCFCTTGDGRLAASYATEKIHFGIMKTGSRVATVVRHDAIELASEFLRLTGFVGFGELELIDSERGLVLLELNARPWSQVVMSRALKIPLLKLAISVMLGKKLSECSKCGTEPLEWLSWDDDLLFCRRLRRSGKPVRASTTSRRVYAHSFLRDPVPTLVYAFSFSRLRPGRIFRRFILR